MKNSGIVGFAAALLLISNAATAELPPECEFVDCSHLEDDEPEESPEESNEGGDDTNTSDEGQQEPSEDPAPAPLAGPLALPDVASDRGKANSAKGLGIANGAGWRGSSAEE